MPVRESVLDVRQPEDIQLAVHPTPWGCREGTAILSQPTSDHIGQIMLTNGSSATSDTHIVQKSGLDWLGAGELVLARPYAGNYFERFEGIPGTVRIMGQQRTVNGELHGDEADWDILMAFRGGEWVPLGGWQLVERPKRSSILETREYLHEGTVVKGTKTGSKVAMFKITDLNRSAFFTFGMGGIPESMMLVHEDFLIEVE